MKQKHVIGKARIDEIVNLEQFQTNGKDAPKIETIHFSRNGILMVKIKGSEEMFGYYLVE